MPTYQYLCTDCGHRFDVVQSIHDEALTTCSECGGSIRRVLHPVGVTFKGSGFYRTDSRKEGKKGAPAAAAAKSGDSGAADKSGSADASSTSGDAASSKGSGATKGDSGSSSKPSSAGTPASTKPAASKPSSSKPA